MQSVTLTWDGVIHILPLAPVVTQPVPGVLPLAGEGGAGDDEGALPPELDQGTGKQWQHCRQEARAAPPQEFTLSHDDKGEFQPHGSPEVGQPMWYRAGSAPESSMHPPQSSTRFPPLLVYALLEGCDHPQHVLFAAGTQTPILSLPSPEQQGFVPSHPHANRKYLAVALASISP